MCNGCERFLEIAIIKLVFSCSFSAWIFIKIVVINDLFELLASIVANIVIFTAVEFQEGGTPNDTKSSNIFGFRNIVGKIEDRPSIEGMITGNSKNLDQPVVN